MLQLPSIWPAGLLTSAFLLALLPLSSPAAPRPGSQDSPATTTVFELGEGTGSQYGFRIPALAVSKKGTLLAFCERRVGLNDHAENDIVSRRSLDGGKTWNSMRVVAEEGGHSLNDPCIVVLESGRVLLRYTRFPKGVHANNSKHTVIAEPGYGGPKNVRIYLTHSDDDGGTWSQPRAVTRAMRREEAISLGSPGVGLLLSRGPHRGRILFPNYEVYHLGGGKRKSANSVSYSDDGGESWKLTATIAEAASNGFGDEAQLVELSNGGVLLTARDEPGGSCRKLSVSRDGGETWSAHRLATDLMTPPCMSSVHRYSWPNENQPGVLLHSLPHTKDRRENGTILISRDEGASWKPARVIVPGSFAYSCLARLPHGDVGCLYETDKYHRIVFARIALGRLTGK